jgi:uncharacterized membrane protein YebE (DUF533 family)
MMDARRILDQLLGGAAAPGRGGAGAGGTVDQIRDYARDNPVMAGGIAGGLAGLLLGRGVLQYGGMGVLGGLAYKAYRDWQAKQDAAAAQAPSAGSVPMIPPPADSPFAPANAPQGESALAETLVVAMVAAAKADGHIDEEERARIADRLQRDGMTAEETAFLERELAAPMDVERLVKAARTREQAVEIYTASLLAIRTDNAAERGYLAMLAARLGLEPDLAASIEKTVAEANR